MLLEKVIILNYQSCRNVELTLQTSEPTILIGINDSGKTALIRAIGLLFNPLAQIAIQRDSTAKRDLSNTPLDKQTVKNVFTQNNLPVIDYTGDEVIIIGKLKIEEGDFEPNIVNDKLGKHLQWVVEKTQDYYLWLTRVFNGRDGGQELFLLSPDANPQELNFQGLWTKTSNELKGLRKILDVSDDEVKNINAVGRFTNLEQIRPLYARVELKMQWCKYPNYNKDADFFLDYHSYNWDFNLKDLEKIAGKAMEGIMNEHTDSLRKEARTRSDVAEKSVNEKLAAYVPMLRENAPTLVGMKTRISYDVKPTVSDILFNKENTDMDIHLESQGEGFKRQIWFGLIRIAAEEESKKSTGLRKKYIWCFDEPETHLYPAAQRIFFDALSGLSSGSFQILLSTHSTCFADRSLIGNINSVGLERGYSIIGKCKDADDIFKALQVRNSDFLFFDKFLFVEGDTEKVFIPHLYKLIKNQEHFKDGLQIISLGGKDKRDEHIKALRSVFDGYRKTNNCITLLLDGDAKHESLSTNGLSVFYVGKQTIEDAMPPSIWMKVLTAVNLNNLITAENIGEIIDSIPESLEIQNNQKFLDKLKCKLIQNSKTKDDTQNIIAQFPQKGEQLGNLLKTSIPKKEEIPEQLIECLKDL
jgi:predicted ATP-dependent endonuclease of OLD family